jgi:hypothetical protein
VGNGGDVDDLDAMLARISQLEQSIGDGGGVGGSAVSRSLPVGGDSGGELDQLFEGIGVCIHERCVRVNCTYTQYLLMIPGNGSQRKPQQQRKPHQRKPQQRRKRAMEMPVREPRARRVILLQQSLR